MPIDRRTFLAASSGTMLGALGLDLGAATARAEAARLRRVVLRSTVCPYCAVGCGAIAEVEAGKILHVSGDPDHPICAGSLCSKGSAMVQVAASPRRLTKVLYRAPGATEWQERDWDWAVREIAARIRTTRDATFTATDGAGRTVNRTEAIACLGGAALNNEECYLYGKLARALGVVYLEHQARICHSSTVAALGASFGRGAMTNHWTDVAHADCILVIGSNAAENHPVSFRWVLAAREHGAKLISADPRFTRTSALADLYVPLRAGTDVALIGGLIHYALEHGMVHRDYVALHTNASFLVDPGFTFEDGCFGPIEDGRYTREHWGYQRDAEGRVVTDPTLEDPNCVFQLLRRHFARYTPEEVSQITGTPVDTLRRLAETFCDTAAPDRSGTILYAMGTTQHTHGTQNIRAYAILQLLLGNIGIAGGGINALRGESNVQGSTDHGLLFDLLPGYLKSPGAEEQSLAAYLDAHTPAAADPQSANWWANYPKYAVSLLKAYWGTHATKQNEFAYAYLPKHEGDASYVAMFEAMLAGQIKGLVVLGQNPAVSSPDAERARTALEKLDWAVVADLWETETATFWKRPGVNPKEVATEVFLLPAADTMEKAGSITNSGRWVQWREAVVPPHHGVRSDLWLLDRLCQELKRQYAAGGVFPVPVVELAWDYSSPEPDPERVAREINGRFLADVEDAVTGRRFRAGEQVPGFGALADDGSTACGNWLYCGSYTESGNLMARRERAPLEAVSEKGSDPLNPGGLPPFRIGTKRLHAGWAWAWPANRRVLYNRAGCDAAGRPWAEAKAVVAFDQASRRWLGDVPDGPWPPPQSPDGTPNPAGRHAFLMLPEGRANLFTPGLADGPLPEHYEPIESPAQNLLSPQQHSPLAILWQAERLGRADEFPIVATTCRLSEHFQSGGMSRNLPWLVELVPEAFVEIGRTLAERKGIENGQLVRVRSARGEITLRALVTGRLRPLKLADREVDQIALIWHFGYAGLATGPSANRLTPLVGDGSAKIPEYKAFLCAVEKAE